MTERLRIVIPGPPVAWARAGSHGAQRFTPAKVRTYGSLVRECAMIALNDYATEWPTDKAVRYDVSVILCRETAIRTDLDNAIKLVGDSLNGLVWADDSQIANVRAVRLAPSKADACMIVDVLPWTGPLPTLAEYLDGRG